MKVIPLISILCIVIGCTTKNATFDRQKTKTEIQEFMNNYAIMLKNQIDKVGGLYYDSGARLTFQGRSRYLVLDSLKASYAKRPKTLEYFKWEDLQVDALAEDAALVTANFYWYSRGTADTAKLSYTGLLVKTRQGWKIKHEHESGRCPRCK
ncbi:MAG TPA: nuclear transport factor 2 family protein [Cyclobacteriaceae bacterium]|jgi:hypothetical protein|nr:nuclear transport factor 2 family protein [Cyclobacteriaceae bacterium]